MWVIGVCNWCVVGTGYAAGVLLLHASHRCMYLACCYFM